MDKHLLMQYDGTERDYADLQKLIDDLGLRDTRIFGSLVGGQSGGDKRLAFAQAMKIQEAGLLELIDEYAELYRMPRNIVYDHVVGIIEALNNGRLDNKL